MQSYRAFSRSERGSRHMKTGIVCQDFALATDGVPGCSIAIAADGHGGADYFRSERGARFIVQAAATVLMEFASEVSLVQLRDYAARNKVMREVFQKIHAKWLELIQADMFDYPFSEAQMENVSLKCRRQYLDGKNVERAYGTTVIAALVTDKYWIGIHQGDGRCIAVRTDGTCEQPIPWDTRCEGNITTSVCDEDVINEFRHCFSEQLPAAVFLCTDGVEDAYPDLDGAYGFCQVLSSIFLSDGMPGLERAAAEYLPNLSRRGSGDDVTVAALFCPDRLEPITEVLKIEERLRRAATTWEQLNRDCSEHEHKFSHVKNTLADQRAAVTRLEKLIDLRKQELGQLQERIRQMEAQAEAKNKELLELSEKLEKAQAEAGETENRDQWMGEEDKRLHTELEQATAEVEGLMDAADEARKQIAQKKRERGEPVEDENYGEDFTEPWAFVNQRSGRNPPDKG